MLIVTNTDLRGNLVIPLLSDLLSDLTDLQLNHSRLLPKPGMVASL